jgi:hypothetical protein
MPICTVPGHTDLRYFLLTFSADGVERNDDPDAPNGLLSGEVGKTLATRAVTDLFLISHGWKGDVPAATEQYGRWIGAMADCSHDLTRLREKRPDFEPLLIGLHWPSLPWGDERLDRTNVSFSSDEAPLIEDLVNEYSERIADTPAARRALSVVFEAALLDISPAHLPTAVRDAYLVLDREAGLGCEKEGAAPGADREGFDPERAYQNAISAEVAFDEGSLDGLLSPLRQLSFWKMKDRARRVGESGGYRLLRSLQEVAANNGRDVRYHLIGHSFGCIVMSAILCGPNGKRSLLEPIDSLFLAQGAVSLWSYCESIPYARDRAGYFRPVIADRKVKGPIIVTLSEHDTAVGKFYPLGAGIRRQITYAPNELPKYGGLGTFGVRGPGIDVEDMDMLDGKSLYGFKPGKVYNLDASSYISKMDGASGAHNDIAHLEVAHAFWQAVIA